MSKRNEHLAGDMSTVRAPQAGALVQEHTPGPWTIQPIHFYRPGSGTEGCCFYEKWCSNCARDANMNSGKNVDDCEPHEICSIIGDTLCYNIDDPKYPKEWIYLDGKPTCTAFVQFVPDAPTPRITDEERAAQVPLPL